MSAFLLFAAIAAPTPTAAPAQSAPQAAEAAPAPARIALDAFGTCVAAASHYQASRVLQIDYTTPEYQRALRALTVSNSKCLGRNRQARIAGVLAAGAIAEGLLEREGGALLDTLPAQAAVNAGRPVTASDAAMMCVIRRDPAAVTRLFGSAPASADEEAALASIMPTVSPCLGQGAEARLSPAGLRAILATAAYRMTMASAAAAKS